MGCCGSNQDKRTEVMLVGLDNAGKTTILDKLQNGNKTPEDGDDVIAPQATIGFNVKQIDYNGLKFTVWDIGGQDATRQLWEHYFQTTNAVIFVIDSRDSARLGDYSDTHDKNNQSTVIDNTNDNNNNNSNNNNNNNTNDNNNNNNSKVHNTAQLELERILTNKVICERQCPILIFANKQDNDGGGDYLNTLDISKRLGIDHFKSKHKIFIQGASAIKYNGIEEGMNWLVQQINERAKQ